MESSDGSLAVDDDGGMQINCTELKLGSGSSQLNGNGMYDTRKDDRYWERRRKNNEAAKRSREKRRMNDIVMEKRIVELSNENGRLRTEIERLRRLYNIADSDVLVALGSSSPPGTSASALSTSDSTTPTCKRRSGGNRATSGGDCDVGAPIVNFSDASSVASSNENDALAEAERPPPNGNARSTNDHVSRKKARLQTCLDVKELQTVHGESITHAEVDSVPNDSVTEQLATVLSAADGESLSENGARLLPDLLTALGVLQTFVKGSQAASVSAPLSVLQQLAALQQLGSLLGNSSNCSNQLSSPPLSTASSSTPVCHQTPLLSAQRTAVLDLSCKPQPPATNALQSDFTLSDGTLVEENNTLRVELDQINAQVRELKEMLLQRDTHTSTSAAVVNRNRRTNSKARDTNESDSDDRGSYSKRSKLAIVE